MSHQSHKGPQAKPRSRELEQGIQNVQDCHRICVETVDYCLRVGGEHVAAAHLRLVQDCAEICATTLTFMLRTSDFHPQLSGACAQVCDACAASCETFTGDQQMEACASACRSCAEACRRVSPSSGA
jgi:hypothetical protein